MSLTTADRLRSQTIQRWHTVQISMTQSVAAHSHCMGIIAEALAELLNLSMSFEDKYYLLKYAQVHDLPEILQGDLSSTYKKFIEEKVPEFKAVQEEMELMLVPELADIKLHFDKKPVLKDISKLADLIEAFHFFTKAKSGDTHHNIVVQEKLLAMIFDKAQAGAQTHDWDVEVINQFVLDLNRPNADSAIVKFEQDFDKSTPKK